MQIFVHLAYAATTVKHVSEKLSIIATVPHPTHASSIGASLADLEGCPMV